MASRSAWTARGAAWTTSSSSGCGAASNTRKSCAVNASSPRETTRSFIGDGGRPPEAGLQGQASNRHKLRGQRALVVSVVGKAGGSFRQGRLEEQNARE